MAGFIVSNSFGKFHSETKKFNAPLSGFPGAPQSYTLREMANAYPSIPSFGYPREWAHDGWQGLVIVDNDDEVKRAHNTAKRKLQRLPFFACTKMRNYLKIKNAESCRRHQTS